jgi:predicted N-acyltransferase
MPYTAHLYDTIDAIPPSQWAGLQEGSCYVSRDWLRLMERQSSHVCRYVAIYDEQNLLAVAPCYGVASQQMRSGYNLRDILAGTSSDIHRHVKLPGLLADMQQRCSEHIADQSEHLFPNMICSSRHGYAPGPLLRQQMGPKQLASVARSLLQAFDTLCDETASANRAFLYLEESHPIAPALLEAGYMPMTMDAIAYLRLEYEDFEAYLRQRSSKRRESIRQEIRAFQRSHRLEVTSLADAPLDRLAELLTNVNNKYHPNQSLTKDNEKYLGELRGLPLDNHLFLARSEDGAVVGFSLFFAHNQRLFSRVIGMDYAALKGDFCYFNVLFYEPIRFAIDKGYRCIEYGIGSLETKISRGCDIVPLSAYVRLDQDLDSCRFEASMFMQTSMHQRRYSDLAKRHGCQILDAAP